MSEYGITPEGFIRKRLDVVLAEMNAGVKAIFGENFNVEPESVDGQINGLISEAFANIWEIAEESYHAFNPSGATDARLSNLVQLNGIRRGDVSFSTVELTLTGVNGTVIPVGSLVSTSDSQFRTDEEVTIPVGLSITVDATAVVSGPVIALAGTIDTIDTAITGWSTVTNVLDALVGEAEEEDPDLRSRRIKSTSRGAQSIIDAIQAEILAVTNVTQATVLKNDTNTGPDANGLPAHSIHAIVIGGLEADIAQAIFIKKTLGATPFGTTTVVVNDSQGIPHDISFSRPTTVDIYVVVNLTTFAGYPSTGDDDVKQAIVDYANGDLIEGRGFFLSDDVIHSEVYTPINTIPGHTVDSMFIKISDPADATLDIPIATGELSQFLIANITVNS